MLFRSNDTATTEIYTQRYTLSLHDAPPISVLTLTNAVSSQGLFLPRLSAILGGAFGLVALLLAVVGLYGVVSFLVARRTQEIGVRIALGAQRGGILRMVLSSGLVLALIGLAIGAGGALLLTPMMGGLLLNVNPRDPEPIRYSEIGRAHV